MGVLAAAGALGGLGKGITEEAQDVQKVNMAQKLGDLEQKRMEAIERLRAANSQQLEQTRIGGEKQLESQREAAQQQIVSQQIGGRSALQTRQEQFAKGENAANRASREKIAAGHDVAREKAAAYAHPRTNVKGPWSFRNVTIGGGPDGKGGMTPQTQYSLLQNKDGRQFVQVGDKFLPYDAGMTKLPDAKTVARAPAADVQDVIQHPDRADAFLRRYNYLPMSWFSAAQQQRDTQMQPPAPSNWKGAAVPPGAQVSEEQPLSTASTQQNGEQEEPPDPAESDESGDQTGMATQDAGY